MSRRETAPLRAKPLLLALLALLALAASGACGSGEAPSETRAKLEPGIVARVGNERLASASVARIARAVGLTNRASLSRAVSDALFAEEARAAFAPSLIGTIERSAKARALLEGLERQAEAEGPPRSTEIDALVRERWTELARPEAARVTHAVVLVENASREARAHELAERLLSAVRGATDAGDFIRRAQAVPAVPFTVRAEQLPAVVADGRTFTNESGRIKSDGTEMDRDFARAALALAHVGDQSPITRSKFGFHVLRLEERIPAQVVPAEQLAELLRGEVMSRRASHLHGAELERLRAASRIERARATDELTSRLVGKR